MSAPRQTQPRSGPDDSAFMRLNRPGPRGAVNAATTHNGIALGPDIRSGSGIQERVLRRGQVRLELPILTALLRVAVSGSLFEVLTGVARLGRTLSEQISRLGGSTSSTLDV